MEWWGEEEAYCDGGWREVCPEGRRCNALPSSLRSPHQPFLSITVGRRGQPGWLQRGSGACRVGEGRGSRPHGASLVLFISITPQAESWRQTLCLPSCTQGRSIKEAPTIHLPKQHPSLIFFFSHEHTHSISILTLCWLSFCGFCQTPANRVPLASTWQWESLAKAKCE